MQPAQQPRSAGNIILTFVIPATIDGQDSERKQIESLNFRIPYSASEEILKEAQLKIYASIHNRRRTFYGDKF